MNDPHKNIFYYYRGPSKREQDEIIYDKQVEDNSTKALVNCFEYCTDNLLKHFIKYFNLNINAKGIPQYMLQASLSKSRPDAQIKFVNNSIYIENKIDAKVSKEQLLNHKKELGASDLLILLTKDSYDKKISNELGIIHIRWGSLFKCFFNYKPINKSEEFLIGQFINFMEVVGLPDFNGFNKDDFDYFINRIEDYKPIVKDKIEKFGDEVSKVLSSEIKSIYTDRHSGKVSKDTEVIWYGIRKDPSSKDIFKRCNFTVEINLDAVNIYTVIRDGKYSDKRSPIGVFYRKINNNFDEFLNILKSLSGDYFLRISQRVPITGNKIMPGNEKWIPMSVLTLEIVTGKTIDYISMLLEKIKYPGIHVGLSIKRGNEILKNPDMLVERGKKVIEEEFKILKFLES